MRSANSTKGAWISANDPGVAGEEVTSRLTQAFDLSPRRVQSVPVMILAFWMAIGCIAQAQLAITEVMSRPSLSCSNTPGSDFWELTNFGTDEIGLSGYQFADDRDTWVPLPNGVVIGRNESIVFFEMDTNGIVSQEQFRAWWGLDQACRVFNFPAMPGLSRHGDSARLRDASGNLVHRVDFGSSLPGVTLTYDTNSGAFGVDSVIGQFGTIVAVAAPEIGSPGRTCGPVPLQIKPPANLAVTAGVDAEFCVLATGLPPPTYQWDFDGTPIAGATSNILHILNAQPANAGNYCVVIVNGLEQPVRRCASLTVSTNPCAPSIPVSPRDCSLFVGQTARFSATVSGYPPPALQWFVNGTEIPNETNRTLEIPICQLETSGSIYCLQASNSLGSTSACALLTITLKPNLRITEAMARSLTNSDPKKDWFEITNLGTNCVDLSGYRYIASRGSGFGGASVIPNGVVIKPDESIICAGGRTREQFVAWWGAANLPQDLQVVSWWGWGISPKGGEAITLWNPSSEDPADAVDQQFTDVFEEGVSLYFDTSCPLGCISVPTDRGTFFALQGRELGSPGYSSAPGLKIERDGAWIVLTGRSIAGRNYSLQCKDEWQMQWSELASQRATNAAVIFRDSPLRQKRFYRLEELP